MAAVEWQQPPTGGRLLAAATAAWPLPPDPVPVQEAWAPPPPPLPRGRGGAAEWGDEEAAAADHARGGGGGFVPLFGPEAEFEAERQRQTAAGGAQWFPGEDPWACDRRRLQQCQQRLWLDEGAARRRAAARLAEEQEVRWELWRQQFGHPYWTKRQMQQEEAENSTTCSISSEQVGGEQDIGNKKGCSPGTTPHLMPRGDSSSINSLSFPGTQKENILTWQTSTSTFFQRPSTAPSSIPMAGITTKAQDMML